MNLQTFSLITALFLLTASCSKKSSSNATGEENAGGVQVNASPPTAETSTIQDFSGAVSTQELNILLSNSDLSCSANQTLIFDGNLWACGDLNGATVSRLNYGESSADGEHGYIRWDSNNDHVEVGTNASGTSIFADESGNVGVGSASPGSKLHVEGQLTTAIPATHTPSGTTQAFDWAEGNLQVIDLDTATGDVTLTFNNAVMGGVYAIKIIQGVVARNITWPAAVVWPDGVAPTITVTDDAVDVVTLMYDGSYFYGGIAQNY